MKHRNSNYILICRRIDVYDASPHLFTHVFLRFVYTGKLEMSGEQNLDSLAELLTLADRYEMDSLKSVVEPGLQELMDADSAISMLSLADNFNAEKLKVFFLETFCRAM